MTLNISVTDEQLGRFYRRISAIAERLDKSLDYNKVMNELQKIHDGLSKTDNSFLHRLYSDEEIWISPTTGRKTIVQSSDVFTGRVDPDFKKWGTNKTGKSTEKTKVGIYEMKKNATFEQMFDSLGNFNKLCFEQEQIINFCLEHPDKLKKDGYGIFFLFKVEGQNRPFVAYVYLDADELFVDVNRFDFGIVWLAGFRRRVVVPQILGD